MFVPLLAVSLAMQLIAAGDGVPQLNVTPSCKGAAQAGYIATTQDRLQSCIDTEHRTRDQLARDWTSFPASARTFCLSSIQGFEPTYTELATCLEMKRDLANMKPGDATPVAPVRRPGAFTTGTGSMSRPASPGSIP
jgi:hypothetical protein